MIDATALERRLVELEKENSELRAAAADARRAALNATSERERYRFLFDNIDEGFCIIEFLDGPHGPLSDYVHIEANAAYARHTGIPNVVGQKVREMVPGEADGWIELYRNVLLTGTPIRFERELVATGRYLELASFRLEPASQRHVAVLFQDVTPRKTAERALQQMNGTLEARVGEAIAKWRAAEEALRQSQKMEAIGQLTGGIAHDFNNMLAVVISSLRLAERRMKRGEFEIQEFLDSAKHGAERAANLVSRLLAFSRQQPLSPERIDANRLIQNMEMVLRRTIPESITTQFVRASGLWPIYADAHGLENAILNLAVNARDAMRDGGSLRIETANVHLDKDACASTHPDMRPGEYVTIAVTDSGQGMPPEVLARVFEPFFTTKEVGTGTGLGLSQIYGFVTQSGGDVKIKSALGEGTTVTLYFPRARDGAAAASPVTARPAPAATINGGGRLVLVVEDEEDVRRLTGDLLREFEFSVVQANGGLEALKLIESRPDIVLMITDVVMPGMNGRVLAERVRELRPDMKVIFSTGYTRDAFADGGAFDDDVDLLMKPFTLEALAAKLARVLG